ncbi:MAG TPA: hypothetical protein IAA98_11525 [Candidatus Avipropionibacterium avicola]|uniref:Uncharacterized protein n=1 Tax=Candidatus Avipropionibacterium avicola TaxID=2840701 RepID=A0A9D1GYM2_9ACTN|nr:hypothetical protein [Candidatus Avipropionibacterium avicola]
MMKSIFAAVVGFEVLVMVIVFFVVPGGESMGWMRVVIPAAVLGITVISMAPFLKVSSTFDEAMRQFRGTPNDDFAQAPIGIGTILDADTTGLSINDVQQYEIAFDVETLDGQRFPATCRQLVPQHELSAIARGTVLPVAYRPDRPGVVELVDEDRMVEAQHIHHQLRVAKGLSDPDSLIVTAEGTPAMGVVLSAVPTGEIRHGHTGLELTIAVTRPDGGQFTTSKVSYLPARHVGLVQPGRQLSVHYLPHDESRVSISLPAVA